MHAGVPVFHQRPSRLTLVLISGADSEAKCRILKRITQFLLDGAAAANIRAAGVFYFFYRNKTHHWRHLSVMPSILLSDKMSNSYDNNENEMIKYIIGNKRKLKLRPAAWPQQVECGRVKVDLHLRPSHLSWLVTKWTHKKNFVFIIFTNNIMQEEVDLTKIWAVNTHKKWNCGWH